MGHYDDSYDIDRDEQYQKQTKNADRDINNLLTTLNLDDKKLLLSLCKNIDKLHNFIDKLKIFNKYGK